MLLLRGNRDAVECGRNWNAVYGNATGLDNDFVSHDHADIIYSGWFLFCL